MYDTDEVIVPKNDTNWADMVTSLISQHGSRNSWKFRNVYFFLDSRGLAREEDEVDIPEYYLMLKYIYRSQRYNPSGNMKSISKAEKTLTLFNHKPLKCLPKGPCDAVIVNEIVAQLQHYRIFCSPKLKSVCQKQYKDHRVKDTSLFNIKDLVRDRVESTLKDLRLFD